VHRRSTEVRLGASVLATGLLAAACAAAPARPDPVTVSVIMADDWASAPAVQDVITEFEAEHDGVRIQVQPAPFSQIADLVRSTNELDEGYDLAHWHAFAAGAGGLAQDIDDLWEQAGLTPERYVAGAVQDVTWDDDVRYGVPLDVNAMVLLADGAALERAELTPEDLADTATFPDVARQLVDVGGSEYALTVSGSSWAAYGWIRAFGGDLLERGPDGEVTFTFDDPRTIAALDALHALIEEGVAPRPFAPDLALDAVQSFTQGRVALHASGSWDLSVTGRATSTELDPDDVVVLPMPEPQGEDVDAGTVLGGSSLFIPTGSDERELAFELMLALTDDEVAMRLAVEEGRLPAARELYDDPRFEADPRLAAVVAELEHADVMPLIAYPGLDGAFSEAVEVVLKGTPADEAMAVVQENAERRSED
jgi:multiple sugar transport system substrate-binding protein